MIAQTFVKVTVPLIHNFKPEKFYERFMNLQSADLLELLIDRFAQRKFFKNIYPQSESVPKAKLVKFCDPF